MASGLIVALFAASLALLSAVWTARAGRTDGKLAERLRRAEHELEACRRERLELRRNEQLVIGALLGLLPTGKRIELLQALDDHTEPIDPDYDLGHDRG